MRKRRKMEVFILFFFIINSEAFLTDYISGIQNYFGIHNQYEEEITDVYERKVPYEVFTADEKFISEAAKLTGVVLSELDSCQHRVIEKSLLKTMILLKL